MICTNKECQAIFSKVSVVKSVSELTSEAKDKDEKKNESEVKLEEGEALWQCEFCNQVNVIDEMEEEEKPTQDTYDYVVDPGPQNQANNSDINADASPVVFVVDTSGIYLYR